MTVLLEDEMPPCVTSSELAVLISPPGTPLLAPFSELRLLLLLELLELLLLLLLLELLLLLVLKLLLCAIRPTREFIFK